MDDLDRGMSAVAQRLTEALAENEKFRAAFADLLSVRDQFAKAVLPQFLELEVTGVWNQSLPEAVSKRDHAQQVANAAYYMADAMMAARTRGLKAPGVTIHLTRDAETGEVLACDFPACAVHHICERNCTRNAGVRVEHEPIGYATKTDFHAALDACPECGGAGEFESALHCEKCNVCGGTGKRTSGVGAVDPVRAALQEMVDMMDRGDEHGAGSPWHQAASAALAGVAPTQGGQSNG